MKLQTQDWGYELPVYINDPPVARSSAEIKQLAAGSETVLRHVRMYTGSMAVGHTSLAATVEIADETLQSYAEACGATLVEHSWGLYPSRINRPNYRPHKLEPINMSLVAEVTSIPGCKVIHEEDSEPLYDILFDNLRAFERLKEGIIWTDAKPNQFALHSNNGLSQLILIDIEPMLGIKPMSL